MVYAVALGLALALCLSVCAWLIVRLIECLDVLTGWLIFEVCELIGKLKNKII